MVLFGKDHDHSILSSKEMKMAQFGVASSRCLGYVGSARPASKGTRQENMSVEVELDT